MQKFLIFFSVAFCLALQSLNARECKDDGKSCGIDFIQKVEPESKADKAQNLPSVLDNGKKCISQMKDTLNSRTSLESQLPILEKCLARELTLSVRDDSRKSIDTFSDAINDEDRAYLKEVLNYYLAEESIHEIKKSKITLPSAIREFMVDYTNDCHTIHSARAKIYLFNEVQNLQDALQGIYVYEDMKISGSPFRDDRLAKIIAKNKGAWSYDSRNVPKKDDWSNACFNTTMYRAMLGNKKAKTLSNADFVSGDMLDFHSSCSFDEGTDTRYAFAGFLQEKIAMIVLISHTTGWSGWDCRK